MRLEGSSLISLNGFSRNQSRVFERSKPAARWRASEASEERFFSDGTITFVVYLVVDLPQECCCLFGRRLDHSVGIAALMASAAGTLHSLSGFDARLRRLSGTFCTFGVAEIWLPADEFERGARSYICNPHEYKSTSRRFRIFHAAMNCVLGSSFAAVPSLVFASPLPPWCWRELLL